MAKQGRRTVRQRLDMLLEYGTAAIGQRILEITDLACRRLVQIGAVLTSKREGEHRSGIVSFRKR